MDVYLFWDMTESQLPSQNDVFVLVPFSKPVKCRLPKNFRI